MREYAGTGRAGLNDEYARERCTDQQQLQETPPGPHGLHLLDFVCAASCVAREGNGLPAQPVTTWRAYPWHDRFQRDWEEAGSRVEEDPAQRERYTRPLVQHPAGHAGTSGPVLESASPGAS